MKKRIVSALAAVLLLTTLAGCGGAASSAASTAASTASSTAASGDLLSQIQDKGEIVFATEGTWAPWTYHDESGTLVGFDIEIAQAVAEKLGVQATFVEGEWDGLLAGLEAGRYDAMANGVDVTPDRQEKYDFSDPYAYIRTAIIVKGDNTDINSFEDLAGKTTANTLSSTYAALAESYGATPTGVDDLAQTIELLLAGRVDATLNAEVTYYDYRNQHPEADLRVAALTEEATEVAFPLRKGAETATLRAAINGALAQLDADGTLTEISEKYFGNDVTRKG